MRVLIAVLSVATFVGCQGEPVAAASADAALDGASSSDAAGSDAAGSEAASSDAAASDAAACGRAGNLVRNGSFEEGGGTSPAHWTDGRFVRREGGADDCAHWAEMTDVGAWASISEAIYLDAPAGTTFRYGFSFRALDGKTAGLSMFLNGSGDDSQRYTSSLTNEWQRFEGTLVLSQPSTKLVIGFNTNVAETRSIGVDAVWVVRQ